MKKMTLWVVASSCILLTACERNEPAKRNVPPNQETALADDNGGTKTVNAQDNTLAQTIRNALQNDPQLSQANMSIKVEVNNGDVILSGYIDSDRNRSQVINLVKQIKGVQSIRNRIDIRQNGNYSYYDPYYHSPSNTLAMNAPVYPNQPTRSPKDMELEQKVVNTLRMDNNLAGPAQNVQINANNGVITLRGSTHNDYDRANIANRVKQISGVSKVDNQIQVSR